MIAHADQFKPRIADTNCTPFFISRRRGFLRMLKLEFDVAIWNWEVRRGLPHYDGSFGGPNGQISRAIRIGRAEKAR